MPLSLRRFAVLVLALASAPARAESPTPLSRDPDHDILNIRIVDVVPGMAEAAARARKNLTFPTRDGANLRFDLYLPAPGGMAPPLVLFLNGVGALEVPDWGQYASWCERVAADGMAAVTHAARRESACADAEDLLKHLRASGASLGFDASRIGAFACSANVMGATPLLADAARAGLSCVALYYGNSRDAALPNVPFLLVRAGLDAPVINSGIVAMVDKALASGSDFELIEFREGHHAFDGLDDAPRSRQVIRRTIAFWRERLAATEDAGRPEPSSPARDALAFWFARDYAAAARAYRALAAARPGDGVAWYRLAQSLLATGDRDASLAPFEKAAELCPKNGPERRTSLFNVACLSATKGEKDAALVALETAYGEGFGDAAALDADPDLATLRSDPRFVALKRKVAATPR